MTETPIDLAAWLRALPLGTVLLDAEATAWQVRVTYEYPGAGDPRSFTSLQCAGSDEPFELANDEDAESLAENAPFTVLYMPPVGTAVEP